MSSEGVKTTRSFDPSCTRMSCHYEPKQCRGGGHPCLPFRAEMDIDRNLPEPKEAAEIAREATHG